MICTVEAGVDCGVAFAPQVMKEAPATFSTLFSGARVVGYAIGSVLGDTIWTLDGLLATGLFPAGFSVLSVVFIWRAHFVPHWNEL